MSYPDSSSEPKKTSPWVWVGLGCGGLLLVSLIVVAIGAFFLYGRVKNFGEQFNDPAVREARVRELLGADEIPEGYYPFMTFSIPWVVDVAILADHPVAKMEHGAHGSKQNPFNERGFVYVHVPMKNAEGKWKDIIEGKRSPEEFLKNSDVRIRTHDTIGRGTIHGEGGVNYHYLASRGEIEMGHEWKEGITTLIGVECPNDQKLRMGIWLGPDPTHKPSEGASGEEGSGTRDSGKANEEVGRASAVFAGTNADEAEIQSFMSHFSLCR